MIPFGKDDNYEVIVVDDGSRDNGAEIVRQYMKAHDNLKLLQQPNSGASRARNHGLENAHGKWIWFVDADDTVVSDAFGEGSCLRQLSDKDDVEMIVFNYQRDYGSRTEPVEDITESETMDGCEALTHGTLYLWNRLFRHNTLEKVRFVDGTKNQEDSYFDVCAMLPLEHVEFLPVIAYSYNQQNMSSTLHDRSKENLKKLSDDTQTIYLHLLEDIKHLQGRQRKIVERHLLFSVSGYLYSLLVAYDSRSLHEGVNFLRNHGLYPVPKTYNARANRFLKVANHEWLFAIARTVYQAIVQPR